MMIKTVLSGAFGILGITVIYGLCFLLREKFHAVSCAYYREKDQKLRACLANSLEESRPIHLDIGDTTLGDCAGGTVLAALETTEAISAQMAFADKPWTITAAGVAASYEKEAVRTAMEAADYSSSFDSEGISSAVTGTAEHIVENFAYLEKEPGALHLSIGSFGPASAIQDMGFCHGEIICTAGNDWLSQAVSTLTADDIYIGEEVFEIPGSLRRNERKYASLLTMDVLRYILIALILIFSAAGLSGI